MKKIFSFASLMLLITIIFLLSSCNGCQSKSGHLVEDKKNKLDSISAVEAKKPRRIELTPTKFNLIQAKLNGNDGESKGRGIEIDYGIMFSAENVPDQVLELGVHDYGAGGGGAAALQLYKQLQETYIKDIVISYVFENHQYVPVMIKIRGPLIEGKDGKPGIIGRTVTVWQR